MTLVNDAGDVVLAEPEAMRALADPAKLALLERLRREGPSTADAAEEPLEELERFGLVTREGSRWRAVGTGLAFEIPDDPEGFEAARELSNAMMARAPDLPGQWLAEDEPLLEPEWVRAGGLLNARVLVTAEELRDLQAGLERLLEPYIARDAVPVGARSARVLAYFLPAAG